MSAKTELGLEDTASQEVVKARWRELSLMHHPDRGGDISEFIRLREIYLRALAEKCSRCAGKGRILVQKGFSSLQIPCPLCKKHKGT